MDDPTRQVHRLSAKLLQAPIDGTEFANDGRMRVVRSDFHVQGIQPLCENFDDPRCNLVNVGILINIQSVMATKAGEFCQNVPSDQQIGGQHPTT